MTKALVTGGAGFIGRWLVKKLLDEGFEVWIIDNLDNGKESNLDEFKSNPLLKDVVIDSILNKSVLESLFKIELDIVYHLAAQINVHESLENPEKAYKVNVEGTYNILEKCRPKLTRILLMGTCMVYDVAENSGPISETHHLKPTSPYAGSKLASEMLGESYASAYGLPLVTCRPFNTYGPFQKTNLEGGVVSIFVKQSLNGEKLKVFGDGTQTRDLLYVEDCIDFLYRASLNDKTYGQILNAGFGQDISINDLARLVCPDERRIQHIEHHHPQSEIQKLLCDSTKAKTLLGWEAKVDLPTGIEKLKSWGQCVSA